MDGPALLSARLLRAPGLPRLGGTASAPVASSQLPLRRKRASGHPRSQRALNLRVAVWPEASVVLVNTPCTELAPVQIRSLQRKCRDWLLWYPLGSRLERIWSP